MKKLLITSIMFLGVAAGVQEAHAAVSANDAFSIAREARADVVALSKDVGDVDKLVDSQYVGGPTIYTSCEGIHDEMIAKCLNGEAILLAPTVVDTIMNIDDQVYQNTQEIVSLSENNQVVVAGVQANAEGVAQNAQDITQLYENDVTLQGNIETLGKQMNQMASNITESISDLNNKVNKLDKKVKSGFASSAALSSLVPNARAAGNTQVSASTGYYDGKVGGAVGVFHYVNDNVLVNAGVSYAGDESLMARAGVTFGF